MLSSCPLLYLITRYLISNHYDYAEVPQVVHEMTSVDKIAMSQHSRVVIDSLSFSSPSLRHVLSPSVLLRPSSPSELS
jgi:hypothetical protein